MATATTFLYRGRGADGKVVKGRIEASSETVASSRLMSMGLVPLSVHETGTGLNREISLGFMSKKVKLSELAVMARQMATMTGAGLSILRALTILADQTESKPLKAALETVARDVETGVGFAESMQKHPDVFPPLMINMVRAGETGGFLDNALDSVAINFEKEAKLRSTIKSAMTYPVMVLCMSLVAVIVMLTFIVPIFAKMFTGLNATLPLPTEILVIISHQMWWFVPFALIVIIAFSIWWGRNKREPKVRAFVDPLRLKLPVFGVLNTKIAIARFCRNFANMTAAGVPILQALRIVGETSGNWVIEQATDRIAKSVRDGKSIAEPMSKEPVFPVMVSQMVAVGEDSGSMETMLNKIADFYDSEVEATTEALTSLIEPLLIAFLGVVIGGIVIALYMPIFGLTTAVQNSGG